jgi:iron complex outermembrane recepter protein
VLLDPSIGGQIFNAGGATIWGVEAEGALRVSNRGRFSASVNYLNSKYDDFLASYAVFCASSTAPGGCVTGLGDLDTDSRALPVIQPDLAGNRPPLSPRWVVTAGYEHTFDLGGMGTLTPSIFTRYKSSYFLDIFNYRSARQGGFTQTDASLEWRDESDRFGVQLYVRNLEDKQPLTYAAFTAAGNDDIFNFQFAAPRTYGMRLLFDF